MKQTNQVLTAILTVVFCLGLILLGLNTLGQGTQKNVQETFRGVQSWK